MQYFATLPSDQVGDELVKRVNEYYQKLQINRHIEKIEKSYRMYYGLGDDDSSRVMESGEQGELLEIRVNHLRSILNHILVLTTQNRPALKAVAVNSDFISQAAAKLGDNLLDYYFKTRNLEQILKDATEKALITGKGYVVMRWDVNAGEEYGVHPETGAVIYDGDVSVSSKSCLEIIEDIYAEKADWFIIRELRNKHDLAAQFPELAEQILNFKESKSDYGQAADYYRDQDQALIPHYTFVHRRSPAVSNGRQVEFLSGDLVLTDGPLPYRELPVYPIFPSKIQGTQLGYSPSFDLLSLNDCLNEVWSAIITILATFSRPNVWTQPGGNFDVTELEGGLNLIESDVKPEILELLKLPQELLKAPEMIQNQMETLSSINDVIRGSPQASLKSGSALALVASQALAYNSGLQASYGDLLMSVGNCIIRLLQDYASTPKVATIVGVANKSMLTEFTGDKLKSIDRVVVEQVSSLSKTTAGRMELANNLLNQGMFTRPEEYLTLIETGSLNPLMESRTNDTMLIRQENEALRLGKDIVAMITDLHGDHIRGHKEVLADPSIRMNPDLVARVTEHIQEHIDQAKMRDPFLSQMVGDQDIPPPMPMGPPPGQEVGPPEGAAQPNQPNLPSLPQEAPEETQTAYQQITPQGA